MYITKENLEEYGACKQGIAFVEKFFPNGAEMLELIQTRHIPHEMLHWGYENLPWNEKEKEMYLKVLDIVNSDYFYTSEKLYNSSFVTKSKSVSSSSFIFSSNNVRDSRNVINSADVSNSSKIYGSNFIYDSSLVACATNITNCKNVTGITYGLDSFNAVESSGVVNSREIIKSKDVENCFFCNGVTNLQHCFFCYGITDESDLLFNKPVSQIVLNNIEKQYREIIGDFRLPLIEEVPEDSIDVLPKLNNNFLTYFNELPERFWQWIKTLPNYDAELMYKITFRKEFLLDKK